VSSNDYERGKTDARLDDHDDHLAKINGSIERMSNEMHSLTLAIQRLVDQGTARDATVITTAAALRDAEKARRDKSEQTWSPFAKTITVLGVLLVAVGILLAAVLR